jgi:formyltetrahydrofolate synthetase
LRPPGGYGQTSSVLQIFSRSASNRLTPEELLRPVPADIDIAMARMSSCLPINDVADDLGLLSKEVTSYGRYKAKVSLDVVKRLAGQPSGKYVVVSAIHPTPLGEGKSTTTLGLTQALGAHMGKKAFANIRQPSQGPTFGVKGGAAGGGYAQAIPMEDFNLHGTGDIHAITAANNLLAAAIDARIFHEATQSDDNLYKRLTTLSSGKREFAAPMIRRLERLGIQERDPEKLSVEDQRRFARLDLDPDQVSWRRVTDVNDRFLRVTTTGQGPAEKGMTRETGFDIAVASECMAILALATDLPNYRDRLRDIVVGYSRAGVPVTCDDIGCAGAMLALLRDTLEPTLMQTLEGTPVFMHAGPFGNIAHGNSSIVADSIALKLVGKDGFVLTEAGFGADMGGEKFFNIKCRASGLIPDAAVLVTTVRSLKYQAGIPVAKTTTENLDAVRTGFKNLERHIENMTKWGVPAVVAINHFHTDSDAEVALVEELTKGTGAFACAVSKHWASGGAGAVDVAKALVAATSAPRAKEFTFTYPDDASLKDKIEAVVRDVYGGDGVEFSELAKQKLEQFEALGYGSFPVCMAKTQYSFSHDPKLLGAPTGFTVPIKDIRASVGARFVFPLLGDMSTMPGLPTRPAYYRIDVDCETGDILGLS